MNKKIIFSQNILDNIFFFLFVIFNIFSIFGFFNLFINLLLLGSYFILNKKKFIFDRFIKIHLFFLLLIMFYCSICIIVFHHNIYYLYVVLRLLVFNLTLYYILNNSKNIDKKIGILLFLLIVNSIITLLSFYNIFNINFIINYLSELNVINPGSSSFIRNGGLMSYIEAGFMSFFSIYILLKKPLDIKSVFFILLIIISCLFQARTPLVFILGLLIIEFLVINKKNIFYLFISLLVILGMFFQYYEEIETNFIWISDIFTLADNKSINQLADSNNLEFSIFYNSNLLEQLFGTGLRNWNSDDLNVINTDSGFLILLRGIGVIGLLLFISYIFILFTFLFNNLYKNSNRKYLLQLLILFVAFIIYNYKGVSFYGLGVSTLFYSIFYLEYFNNKSKKELS